MIAFIFALVFLGALIEFKKSSTPEDTPLEISFVGFTNSYQERPYASITIQEAIFKIHNPHNRAVIFMLNRNYKVLENDTWMIWEQKYFSESLRLNPLPANGTTNYFVHLDGNILAQEQIWKMPLRWGFVPSRMDYLEAFVRQNWSAFRQGGSVPGRKVKVPPFFHGALVYSPAITNNFP